MSIESAKAFLERVKSDEDLLQQLSDENLSGEDRLDLARAEGFEFTREEILQARSELSEEDLAAVSGGASFVRGFGNEFKERP